MSFHRHADRARDPTGPVARRRAALRACLASYCRLTRQAFAQTAGRFESAFGPDVPAALGALEAERDVFLGRLRLYAVWKGPRTSRRPPAEVRRPLYRPDYFVVGPTAEHPRPPRAYAVALPHGGWRLVKDPPAGRRQIMAMDAGGWANGPWAAGEIAAFFLVGGRCPFAPDAVAEFLNAPTARTLDDRPTSELRGGVIEGLTLRPIGPHPFGSPWAGRFTIEPGRQVVVRASVGGPGATTDLVRHVPLRPEACRTDDELLAHVYQELSRIEFRGLELRALRIEFTRG